MGKYALATLLAVLLLSAAVISPSPCYSETISARVKWVIDGDTIVLEGGRKARYVGIDTPEKDEPFYSEARKRNASLVKGRKVTLVVCGQEPRDKYGRLLVFVYSDGVFVNRVLLEEGLAKRMIIPPCGLPVAREFKEVERRARDRGLGVWGRKR